MMISFSLPGLPSPFSLRMPFASCGSELLAIERVGTTALNPKAEITEAKRSVNILRVEARFIDHSFPFGLRNRYQGNAKLNTSLPAAIATYCFPATAYVIGDALISCPVLKCHSGLPDRASTASKEPASSAKNTKPPAVAMVPPEECPPPICGYFQAMEFVSKLKATKTF